MTKQVFTNGHIATLRDIADYGLIHNGAMVVENKQISWIGPKDALPVEHRGAPETDLGGKLVTPALIDCHTHLIHGGNRAEEFQMRLNGATYEEIARNGGGILSTVRETRKLNAVELAHKALPYAQAFKAEGVSTLEIKSGYGLNIDSELDMLRAARLLAELTDLRICTTFLAAHAIPAEYKDRADAYIDEIVLPAMTKGQEEGLIDAVDGFCENIAFSPEQMRKVFNHAQTLDLRVKLHAEQLTDQNGAALVAEFNGLSADHLEYLSLEGVKALKKSGTVATLLPGAFYFLRETKLPPIDALRAHNVPMAIASDSNPGSSPLNSLLLAMNMACTLMRLTPQEALAGTTLNAAKALGLENQIGSLETGKRAEFAVWNIEHPAELSYRIGFNPLHQLYL